MSEKKKSKEVIFIEHQSCEAIERLGKFRRWCGGWSVGRLVCTDIWAGPKKRPKKILIPNSTFDRYSSVNHKSFRFLLVHRENYTIAKLYNRSL
jgi:hypothetical protein